jgi:hypothetical protein
LSSVSIVNVLKRLLPLLLIVLAMFYGTPRQSCMCSDAASTQSLNQTVHSCCKQEVNNDCISSRQGICARSDCCGMTGKYTAALAGSISLLPNTNQIVGKVIFLTQLADIYVGTRSERVHQLNRAPPHIVGMGTSKTYLHKRCFLI